MERRDVGLCVAPVIVSIVGAPDGLGSARPAELSQRRWQSEPNRAEVRPGRRTADRSALWRAESAESCCCRVQLPRLSQLSVL